MEGPRSEPEAGLFEDFPDSALIGRLALLHLSAGADPLALVHVVFFAVPVQHQPAAVILNVADSRFLHEHQEEPPRTAALLHIF